MPEKLNFQHFCDYLRHQLTLKLPGYAAQQRMEPPSRRQLMMQPTTEAPRQGAVLIGLFPDGDDIFTMMIRRAVYDGVHSGQIAFPGGRREPSDHDLIQTALREAAEEVGIDQKQVVVAGTLSSLYIPPSNFVVLPVVAFLNSTPELRIQEEEVNEAFFVSVRQLANPDNCRLTPIILSSGITLEAPSYTIGDKIIWGATAMIISELLQLLPNKFRLQQIRE
ncbi:MAG: CoA pyrophosphatase [Bacteroidetes bacterium]|nr:CoA pyrophosphatase [Bacteroidota bacterium]